MHERAMHGRRRRRRRGRGRRGRRRGGGSRPSSLALPAAGRRCCLGACHCSCRLHEEQEAG
eukprot:2793236-Rhodomonas_salina.1